MVGKSVGAYLFDEDAVTNYDGSSFRFLSAMALRCILTCFVIVSVDCKQ